MRAVKAYALGIATCVAVLVIGFATFIGSGIYDIGADDHHSQFVLRIIETLRERSIGTRAATIEVPPLEDPRRIASGASRYSELCIGCHLAPGVTKSALRTGLYPHPPNLEQAAKPDAQRAFWIIKHGIKMSAMPAWGKSMADTEIWDVVAFLRQLPTMSPETYQQLSRSR